MHHWLKVIQVCLNERPRPFPRGDNLKIFLSRTTGPISTKLGTKHLWVKGIQVCSIEGPRPWTRPSVSQSLSQFACSVFCQRNFSETAQQNLVKLFSYDSEGHIICRKLLIDFF